MEAAASPRPSRPLLYRTRGLGTRVEILVTDPDALVAAASMLLRHVRRIDEIASRFRPDSEITEVNQAEGRPVRVSPDLIEVLGTALAMAEATDGLLDPTVGGAMRRLGYDRDFASVCLGVDGALPPPNPVPGWRSVEVDESRLKVRVPAGTELDLGATAKAWTADRAAQSVATQLGCGTLVSLGGDIAVAGEPPAGGFAVAIADVCGGTDAGQTVAIADGGLATSGIAARRWKLGDDHVHHIMDPSTGRPADSPWRTVSVAAASCVAANAAATASIIRGDGAPAWLGSLRLPARLVAHDGVASCTTGWPGPAGPAAPRPQVVA